MDNTKEILTLAVEIGDAMLRCGAEIYRVEDSVIRILEAFGLDDFDAYVLLIPEWLWERLPIRN